MLFYGYKFVYDIVVGELGWGCDIYDGYVVDKYVDVCWDSVDDGVDDIEECIVDEDLMVIEDVCDVIDDCEVDSRGESIGEGDLDDVIVL